MLPATLFENGFYETHIASHHALFSSVPAQLIFLSRLCPAKLYFASIFFSKLRMGAAASAPAAKMSLTKEKRPDTAQQRRKLQSLKPKVPVRGSATACTFVATPKSPSSDTGTMADISGLLKAYHIQSKEDLHALEMQYKALKETGATGFALLQGLHGIMKDISQSKSKEHVMVQEVVSKARERVNLLLKPGLAAEMFSCFLVGVDGTDASNASFEVPTTNCFICFSLLICTDCAGLGLLARNNEVERFYFNSSRHGLHRRGTSFAETPAK